MSMYVSVKDTTVCPIILCRVSYVCPMCVPAPPGVYASCPGLPVFTRLQAPCPTSKHLEFPKKTVDQA